MIVCKSLVPRIIHNHADRTLFSLRRAHLGASRCMSRGVQLMSFNFCTARTGYGCAACRSGEDLSKVPIRRSSIYCCSGGDRKHACWATLIPHFKKGDFDKLQIPLLEPKVQKFLGDTYFDLSVQIDLNPSHRPNA